MEKHPTDRQSPTLRELYPTLSLEELEIAEKNLDRYLVVAWEIWEASRNSAQPDFDRPADVP